MYVYAVFVFSVIGLVVACRSTSTCNNFLLALLSAFVGYSLYRFNKMSDAQGQLSAEASFWEDFVTLDPSGMPLLRFWRALSAGEFGPRSDEKSSGL